MKRVSTGPLTVRETQAGVCVVDRKVKVVNDMAKNKQRGIFTLSVKTTPNFQIWYFKSMEFNLEKSKDKTFTKDIHNKLISQVFPVTSNATSQSLNFSD